MNWGRKLMLVFIAFAGLMIFLVYKAMHTHYDLVSKNYYQDELRYQDKIDGIRNAAGITPVAVTETGGMWTIQFPAEVNKEDIHGEAWFYAVTDASRDVKMAIQPDANGRQQIPASVLKKGNYTLKLSWESASKHYYSEHLIQQ